MRLSTRVVRVSGIAVLLAIFCLAGGCASDVQRPSDALFRSGAIERRCGPPPGPHPNTFGGPSKSHSRDGVGQTTDVPATRDFSLQAFEVADIIGARDLVMQVPALEREVAQNAEGAILRLLRVRQQLSDRILLAFLDVARTAAEADCEEERADQLADRLQEVRDKRIRRQTLIAIVGDAMIGIVSGALSLALQATASAATAILGGSVATGFGMAAFFDSTSYEFQHERNLLREVWEGQEHPSLIPLSVWRYLNQPLSEDPARRSLRETLITRWRQDGRLGEAGSETEQRRITLFFGQGGSYDIEDLRARAAMLDLLEADINLMSQDLERFMQEVLAREADR